MGQLQGYDLSNLVRTQQNFYWVAKFGYKILLLIILPYYAFNSGLLMFVPIVL